MTAQKDAAYINPRTGALWPTSEPLWNAPDDGKYINLTPGAGLTPDDIDRNERSFWRYGVAVRLPQPPEITLGAGWTPLLPAAWNGTAVHMKAEYLMTSGSFKDRGTAVMLNYLKQVGITSIFEDSSGNAGASVATYSAALGLDCRIMVPAAAPAAKKIQMAAMGAEVISIEGSRDDVAEAALAEAATCFYASHNYQPHFLEGTKTLAFELWEQCGFQAPDCVVAPLGYGSNIMGCHIGFAELLAAGQIETMPRIYAVQAANCAPYHAAFESGGNDPVSITPQPTIADGIASAVPLRLHEVLSAVRETDGAIVAVPEDEIVAALRQFAGLGFFVEPTSGTAGAGLTRLLDSGAIKPNENVAVVLTGSGLKAVEKIGTALGLNDA
ncbi:MAG: pyridoxal-phosphate dependent enzyme [Alphaproteobacteria bacterium]|nr:pyridoxal-phosphate dependent enzyme [Alphaproteobacteria bacterium]